MLGDRTLATFKRFVVAEATGVIVHDRYQNYDSAELGEHEHQLCCSHLLRDLEDCAETYPDAIEIQTALRGLIHAPLDATRPDPGLKPRLGRIRSHPTPITHRDQDTPDCIKAECLRPLLKCGSATETQ
jgi:hypothetical protein